MSINTGGAREENDRLLRIYHGTQGREREAALEALMVRNMPLVQGIARRFADRVASLSGVDMEDIVSLGQMGLLRAIKGFDFSYDAAFSTYAVPLIVGEIRRFLRDGGAIRVSRETKKKAYALMRLRASFEMEQGRAPTVGELAALSGEDACRIGYYLDAVAAVSSLSMPIGEDGTSTLEEVLFDGEDSMDGLCERLSLSQAVAGLSPEERRLISLRYEHNLTQMQTAAIMGTSQVRISRMEKKVFARLREKL